MQACTLVHMGGGGDIGGGGASAIHHQDAVICVHIREFSRDWYGFIYNLCHDHFNPKTVSWFVSELSSEFYADT